MGSDFEQLLNAFLNRGDLDLNVISARGIPLLAHAVRYAADTVNLHLLRNNLHLDINQLDPQGLPIFAYSVEENYAFFVEESDTDFNKKWGNTYK
jgi:hypothetical protein